VVSKDTAAATAAGAVVAGAVGAGIAAKAAVPPASQTAAPAAPPVGSGAVSETQKQLAKASSTPANLQKFESEVVIQTPAKASKPEPKEGSGQPAGVNAPAAPADSSVVAREQARQQLAPEQLAQQQFAEQQLARDQLAEKKRRTELIRKAELARKAEQAKRDAAEKRRLELANLDRRARLAHSLTTPRNDSASRRMQIASAPPQSQRAIGGAGNAGSGNQVARTEPPIDSAPIVVKVAPGIPVAPHAILISPPDHSVYWSLQNSGLIYRTNDRKSWVPESTGVHAELLAGMAPSGTVCWAVGRHGVILLTTDGVHWDRINSPTSSDVIGIVAASKDVATIFTAGGVNYSTFDGGSNWENAN
jgi:hypothetical protein